ncbi:transposase, IS4 family [Acinetobacter lwoffii SH145]|nr:transposase, IS4 family [Acinetobacter lwoffii SH145]
MLRQYSIVIVQVFRGETYPNGSVILESYIPVLAVGLKQACGREFLKCYHMTVIMNMPCWTQPLCALINTVPEKKEQAIGRSKGGLSTKIHARTDALGNPTGFYLTAGQAHDLNGADVLLDLSLSQTWLMDKAYNSRDRVIDPIHKINGQVVMPSKSNAIDQRDYDQHLYKARHLIENFFAKLKQYRGIATRYDKLAQNFLSAIYLASIMIWLN